MNPRAEGKVYPETRFVVAGTQVDRFRVAVGGDTNTGVPLTFVTTAEFASFPAVIGDPELALDFSRVVHAEQEYEFTRPLRVGESLVIRPRIALARTKGGQGFVTIETRLVEDDGSVVATARATMLERGAS
jgi:acyl-CoA thioesterase FadM